jgi:hypothetical protein
MKSSNLSNLLQDAVNHRQASASNGKWVAVLVQGDPVFDLGMVVEVFHHGTHMFDASMGCIGQSAHVAVTPVDPGHGSTSDRCGVRRITEGAYVDGIGYKELYDENRRTYEGI